MLDSNFKIQFTRGHGPGGQHKNKVETCVKITHIPSGLTEVCQDTRSRQRNINIASERILSKIKDIELKEKADKQNEIRRAKIKSNFKRRTYNFKTNLAVDHVSGKKADLNKVLNGNLELMW